MSSSPRDELVALTCDLMRFPSTADRPEEIAAAITYIERYLEPIPGLYCYRSESDGKAALVVSFRDTRAPALMLNAHIDVVAAQPAQFEPELRNGRIYGRASQDMKGSAAVMLRLLKDLAARDERPDVGFQFVGDEEIGGFHGTGRLLEEGWRCDFFIALEPTDMRICYEQKGLMWLELRLPGAPAHGSRPWEGHNPLLDLSAGLARLQQRFPASGPDDWRTTVTPTIAETIGSTPNQVPAAVTLTLDIRHINDETPDMIRQAIQTCFPTATLTVDRNGTPLATRPETPSLQRLAAVNAQVRGQPTLFYREHFASDARFYSAAGIPAICFGPVGYGLHSDEEWVDIDSLVQLYDVLHTLITQD